MRDNYGGNEGNEVGAASDGPSKKHAETMDVGKEIPGRRPKVD